MIIAALIVPDHSFLNALGGDCQRQMNLPVRTARRCKHPDLNGVQSGARISAGHIRKKISCFLVDHCLIAPHAFFAVRHGTADQFFDLLFPERLQFKNDRAGQKSPVHLEIRIFRGSADQYQCPILHEGKKIILLSFVKTVDLIDEQDRLPAIHAQRLLRFMDHFFHILLAGHGRVDLPENGAGRIRDHLRKGGLPGPGRAVKND